MKLIRQVFLLLNIQLTCTLFFLLMIVPLKHNIFSAFILAGLFCWVAACSDEAPGEAETSSLRTTAPTTENVVIVVIDGPRYSETWGEPRQQYIPYMREMAREGTFFSNFQNNGPTYTLAGHTAITTGHYQHMDNNGQEPPLRPTILQQYLQHKNLPPHKASLITSKEKLKALANCRDINWRGRYLPDINCGQAGKNRADAETLQQAFETLEKDRPGVMLVQFLGPDAQGHANNWPGYLASIQETDSLVHALWQFLEQDKHYAGKTALLVTNDHGRHANHHKDGFINHGDNCKSCRHISLLAMGPAFKKGLIVTEEYEQADLPVTIAKLLGFEAPANDGTLILPLLAPNTP